MFRELDRFAINAIHSKKGDELRYECVVNDMSIAATFVRRSRGAILKLTDGFNDVSANVERITHQSDVFHAITEAFAELLDAPVGNVLGVFFVTSATSRLARCGRYSSGSMPHNTSDKDLLFSLASHIVDELP